MTDSREKKRLSLPPRAGTTTYTRREYKARFFLKGKKEKRHVQPREIMLMRERESRDSSDRGAQCS